ncbi:4-hydroxy-tetrahydrodipicolinate reductase [Clostridium tepidiprofundi DSM 19306]|uniref:4-hydroxy-tetrahydrodipicolinate reductase n=1 Tax=Clostridium tepidiprofundi DSM 19306 TaxID=1121338 RepID=A0A151B741_9CLOT|nr:4-hydroxy-tetrahydrodipicolinate reductase [Clostridium tepidiprofundi]KYH35562.1 4-hydroxy-tetrahydrodipicolinate reductase [Clostridium tepidiprofundi DSM 19306]
MIRIILNGCFGKMGKMVTQASYKFENLTIVAGIDVNTNTTSPYPVFNNIDECNIDADVILDFSRPAALPSLAKYCIKNNMPIVICTTGFDLEGENIISNLSKKVAVFRSANMSVGINVINNILKKISSYLYKGFDIEIIEKHHNQKIDAPSGTALMLANTIKSSIEEETIFSHGRVGECKRHKKEIGIHAIRGGNIVGEHDIIFAGQGEIIEIKHSAISREVFAIGALDACKFIHGKQNGLYNMDNIIDENISL